MYGLQKLQKCKRELEVELHSVGRGGHTLSAASYTNGCIVPPGQWRSTLSTFHVSFLFGYPILQLMQRSTLKWLQGFRQCRSCLCGFRQAFPHLLHGLLVHSSPAQSLNDYSAPSRSSGIPKELVVDIGSKNETLTPWNPKSAKLEPMSMQSSVQHVTWPWQALQPQILIRSQSLSLNCSNSNTKTPVHDIGLANPKNADSKDSRLTLKFSYEPWWPHSLLNKFVSPFWNTCNLAFATSHNLK